MRHGARVAREIREIGGSQLTPIATWLVGAKRHACGGSGLVVAEARAGFIVLGRTERHERVDTKRVASAHLASEELLKLRATRLIGMPIHVQPPIGLCGKAPRACNGPYAIAKSMQCA